MRVRWWSVMLLCLCACTGWPSFGSSWATGGAEQGRGAAPGVEPAPGDERDATEALLEIEARLAGTERDRALRDLVAFAQQRPADARIARRLLPLLHQRALLRYGQGELASAVADWRLWLDLCDSDNARRDQVRSLLRDAEQELASLQPRGSRRG